MFIFYNGKCTGAVDEISFAKVTRYSALVLGDNKTNDHEKEFATKQEAINYIKKQKPMSTKKPTEKQLAARKRFTAMAKSGELAKKRKAAAKTPAKGKLGAPKTKRVSAKKLCAPIIAREGVKKDGTLKKGYRYAPGGKVVKAKPVAKKAAKKAATTKKKK